MAIAVRSANLAAARSQWSLRSSGSWTNRAAAMEVWGRKVRNSARRYGIRVRRRKQPYFMSLDPSPQSQQDRTDGASVISFSERRAQREAQTREAPEPAVGESRVRIAAVTDTCYCCRSKVRAIVGAIVDPALTRDRSGFLPLDQVDEALVGALDSRTLSLRGIGELRHRESPGVEGGYIANGCVECDALIGRFHLEDLLADHRNAGGSLGQLDSGIALELDLAPAERRTSYTAFA